MAIGLVLSLALCAVFPPTIVMVIGIAIWWYFSDQAKKKRLREQAEWYRQQGPPR